MLVGNRADEIADGRTQNDFNADTGKPGHSEELASFICFVIHCAV